MRSVASAISLVLATAGCSGPDNSALVAKDASPSDGAGGSGGSILDAPGTDVDAQPTDGGEDAPVLDAPPADSSFVSDGPSVFTFFHGIPNARAVRVCFEVQEGGALVPQAVRPVPDNALGLLYGSAFSGEGLDGVDLETHDVRPVVFAGALEKIAEDACDELDSPPEGVARVALEVIPAGSLARGRSVLMVASGCVAGPVDDPNATAVCGPDFTPSKGNASLLIASMERTSPPGALGFQVFAGSRATAAMGLVHTTAFPSMSNLLASNLSPGKIAPRPPSTVLSVANLGTSPEENLLQVHGDNMLVASAVSLLTDALARGGLSLDALQDGKNYTVVVAGPSPALEGSWYKPMVITVISSDP